MTLGVWLAFFAASWAISLSPGAGAVAAMSAGLTHGFRRGWVVVIGLILGIWTQVLIVAAGLGALIAASAQAFSVVKWLGAAYLVWLGVQQWRAPALALHADDTSVRAGPAALVLRAWGINALNPKGTVFLLAIVPQFIDPTQPLAGQYLIVGATLGFTDLVVMCGYTALASRVLRGLRTPAQVRRLNRFFGGLFIAAGAALASFKRGAL